MTSCLRKPVRVCLAVISLTAFSHRIFKHNNCVKCFTWKYQTMLHFLCRCSYLFTFLLSSQVYWHIRLKATAYFFDPPCIQTWLHVSEINKYIVSRCSSMRRSHGSSVGGGGRRSVGRTVDVSRRDAVRRVSNAECERRHSALSRRYVLQTDNTAAVVQPYRHRQTVSWRYVGHRPQSPRSVTLYEY